jgi:thiamine biosynthesis lipoprotein
VNPGTPAASPRPSLSLKTWLAAVGLLLVLLGAVIGWRLAHQEREVQHCSRFLLNTVCSLHVPGGPEWGPVLDRVLDETARLNVLFNPHDPQSPVYAFNVRHEPVRDPEIAAVVAAALQVSRESGGAFDVTIFPLVSLWREARRQNRPPPPAAIEQAKTRVDWRRLSVADSRVDKAKPEVQMDLGGIAKGYAAAWRPGVCKLRGCARDWWISGAMWSPSAHGAPRMENRRAGPEGHGSDRRVGSARRGGFHLGGL